MYNNYDGKTLGQTSMKLEFEKLEPAELVSKIAKNLSDMLESKMVALNVSLFVSDSHFCQKVVHIQPTAKSLKFTGS